MTHFLRSKGGFNTPRSVMIAVISRAGVTSNAGWRTAMPSGAMLTVRIDPSRRARGVRHLVAAPLLDRDVAAARAAEIDGGPRRGDVERHPVGVGKNGDSVRADLVRGVAVGGDAVRAHEHGVERFLLKEMPGHAVGDQRDVDAVRCNSHAVRRAP